MALVIFLDKLQTLQMSFDLSFVVIVDDLHNAGIIVYYQLAASKFYSCVRVKLLIKKLPSIPGVSRNSSSYAMTTRVAQVGVDGPYPITRRLHRAVA
jgi:hypothetical protein